MHSAAGCLYTHIHILPHRTSGQLQRLSFRLASSSLCRGCSLLPCLGTGIFRAEKPVGRLPLAVFPNGDPTLCSAGSAQWMQNTRNTAKRRKAETQGDQRPTYSLILCTPYSVLCCKYAGCFLVCIKFNRNINEKIARTNNKILNLFQNQYRK